MSGDRPAMLLAFTHIEGETLRPDSSFTTLLWKVKCSPNVRFVDGCSTGDFFSDIFSELFNRSVESFLFSLLLSNWNTRLSSTEHFSSSFLNWWMKGIALSRRYRQKNGKKWMNAWNIYSFSSLHNFSCLPNSSAFDRTWPRLAWQFRSSLFSVVTIVANSSVDRPSFSNSSVSCWEALIRCCTKSAVRFLSLASFNFSLNWSISLKRDLKTFTYNRNTFKIQNGQYSRSV